MSVITLLFFLFLMISIFIVCIGIAFFFYRKYSCLKVGTNLLLHDIKSSLAILTLATQTLKERFEPETMINGAIQMDDLLTLIDISEKANHNIFKSINSWNEKSK